MKYKILTKYTSVLKKDFYELYKVPVVGNSQELVDFETDNLEVLKTEIKKIDKSMGFDNIRIIADVTYDIGIKVNSIDISTEFITDEELNEIYSKAYNNVFGKVGE